MRQYILDASRIIIIALAVIVVFPIVAITAFSLRYILLLLIPLIVIGYVLYPLVKKISIKAAEDLIACDGVSIAKGIFIHPKHSWLRIESEKKGIIGVDDFMQKLLGPVNKVRLPQINKKVKIGEPLFQLQRSDREITVTSPVTGIVTAINYKILNQPHLINTSPYHQGWVVRVKSDHLSESMSHLRSYKKAVSWLKAEVDKFRLLVSSHPSLSTVVQDGGHIVNDLSPEFDDQVWASIQSNFFK